MPNKLESMHPAWFASLMSTAGIALAALLDPFKNNSIDEAIGLLLTATASVLALTLLMLFFWRWWRFPAALAADLRHPMMGPLTTAGPAGLMVLSVAIAQAGTRDLLPSADIASATLLAVGLAGTVALGFEFYLEVVHNGDVAMGMITGAWFIPVVPLVLVPNVLIRLASLGFIMPSDGVTLFATAAWGAGIFLFTLLAAIIGHRLLTLAPPPPAMAATWWIWLAPAGAGGLGALANADLMVAAEWIDAPDLAALPAIVLWGFGIWWLLFAAIVLLRQRRDMHFHLGTWGFGFPSAAISALTLALGNRLEIAPVTVLGTAMITLTLALWPYLAWRTLQGVRSGKVFLRA